MSSSVPACTFLPFCFLCILPPWASPLDTLATQLPPYPSRVASLLFSASFPSSKGSSSSSTDSMRSLYSSHSGETETLSQGKLALPLWPSLQGRRRGHLRTDIAWVPGSTQGIPHLIPQPPSYQHLIPPKLELGRENLIEGKIAQDDSTKMKQSQNSHTLSCDSKSWATLPSLAAS